MQYIADLFWKWWISEYLPVKQVGTDMVHSKKKSHSWRHCRHTAPRSSWITGKVLEAKPDTKDLVHTVRLQTIHNILERPVQKVCLLLEATD